MKHSTLRRRERRSSDRRISMDLQPGPRPSTLQAILSYSKALSVVEAPPLGTVALVLN
ncbi:MAG TPA: hypothetical protein PKE21_00120 [Flavobacteriales bacterium]|nr:hypothetical protein [Flavobacteriales bacterium]HMR25857.1 hypothetical protein [Flavobacteriales bacterium]